MSSFQVFASYISPISGAEIRYQLVEQHRGVAFRNIETGKIEAGTYRVGDDKFAALDAFRRIFGEMQPTFELK